MVFKILNKLQVSPLDKSKWEVTTNFKISVNERVYAIPKGFVFDFASTPRFTWILFPPATGSYRIPAVLHDYMYHTGFNRAYADKIFLHLMRYMTVNVIKAYVMYYAVRWFGWIAYKSKSLNTDK